MCEFTCTDCFCTFGAFTRNLSKNILVRLLHNLPQGMRPNVRPNHVRQQGGGVLDSVNP